jgi:hypothetical protein
MILLINKFIKMRLHKVNRGFAKALMLGLILNLLYSFDQQIPALKGRIIKYDKNPCPQVAVILIPFNDENRKALSGNNIIYCDDVHQINEWHAKITLTNSSGYYYFYDLENGKYLLKVCKFANPYQEVSVNSNTTSTQTIQDIAIAY